VNAANLHRIAREFRSLRRDLVRTLLRSRIHDERALALLILARSFEKAVQTERAEIAECYLAHTQWINNWDLVDIAAAKVLGTWLVDTGEFDLLDRLASSDRWWERRIAMVATHAWTRQDVYEPTLRIARLLLWDTRDLLHKAAGWMLREVGKRDEQALELFLDRHAHSMPRTMLRYAIERFDDRRRGHYMAIRPSGGSEFRGSNRARAARRKSVGRRVKQG
jgi:3-methyladenine DNA glycosylase AlkD